MTGFIPGGTILGSYLCSLIRKCILPGPRKNEVVLYALPISLAAKQRSRRNGVQQSCRQAVRNTEHSNLTGHFPVPVLCCGKKTWERERDAQGLCETAKGNEGKEQGLWWNWYPVEEKVVIQWFHLQKEYFACNSAGVSPKPFNIFMNNLPSAIESVFVKTVEELEKVSEKKIRIQTNSGMLVTWLGKSLMAQHKKRKNEMPEWERKN